MAADAQHAPAYEDVGGLVDRCERHDLALVEPHLARPRQRDALPPARRLLALLGRLALLLVAAPRGRDEDALGRVVDHEGQAERRREHRRATRAVTVAARVLDAVVAVDPVVVVPLRVEAPRVARREPPEQVPVAHPPELARVEPLVLALRRPEQVADDEPFELGAELRGRGRSVRLRRARCRSSAQKRDVPDGVRFERPFFLPSAETSPAFTSASWRRWFSSSSRSSTSTRTAGPSVKRTP